MQSYWRLVARKNPQLQLGHRCQILEPSEVPARITAKSLVLRLHRPLNPFVDSNRDKSVLRLNCSYSGCPECEESELMFQFALFVCRCHVTSFLSRLSKISAASFNAERRISMQWNTCEKLAPNRRSANLASLNSFVPMTYNLSCYNLRNYTSIWHQACE